MVNRPSFDIFCNKIDYLFTKPSRAYLAVALAIIDTLLFSGIQYGFTALIPVLKAEKIFSNVCDPSQTSCEAQEKIYSYAFIIWTVIQMVAMFPLGIIYDKIGLRAVKFIDVGLAVLGSICFAFISPGSNWVLFLCGILTSVGSVCCIICNFSVTASFPKYRSLITSIISGSFDTSTIIFTIIRVLYQNNNVHYRIPFLIHAVLALISGTILGVFFLTRYAVDMDKFSYENLKLLNRQKVQNVTANGPYDIALNELQIVSLLEHEGPEIDNKESGVKKQETIEEFYERLKSESFPDQKSVFCSHGFFICLIFLSVAQLRFAFFLAQLSQQIAHIFTSEPEIQIKLPTDLNYFLFVGLIVAPICGFITDLSKKLIFNRMKDFDMNTKDDVEKTKFYWMCCNSFQPAFLIEITATTIYSILIFIYSETAWYLAFFCFLLQREFLFSTFASFIIFSFPIKYFGTTYGLIYMLAGIFGLFQYAFLQGLPAISNGVLLAISVTQYVLPVWLYLLTRFPRATCIRR